MYPCDENIQMCAICETGDLQDMLKVPVLIVEDDIEICELFKNCIESTDLYSVQVAHTIEQAHELIVNNRFVVVLMDLQLGLDIHAGAELAKFLRSRDDLVNIIVITGHCEAATHPSLLEAEINDFIEKPVNMRHLRIKLLLWSARYRRRKALRSYVDTQVYEHRLAVIKEINDQLEVFRAVPDSC